MKSGDLVVLIQPQDSFVAVSGPGAIGLPASQTGKPVKQIDAIADGRRSAADIHRAIGGDPVLDDAISAGGSKPEPTFVKLRQFHRLADDYLGNDRVAVPTLETGRRVGLAEVELGFTESQARCEAARCLRCFANIILDVHKCVLCGLCADVCPVDVISFVPSEEVAPGSAGGTALLLDEERCVRCALCIERCPPDALSMGVWKGVGVPAMGLSQDVDSNLDCVPNQEVSLR